MQIQSSTQVALITGAARRIGAAIATQLHAAGMNVIIHYHTSRAAAEQLCAALNLVRPNSSIALGAALTDFAAIKPLISQAVDSWGRLDVLVNNASCFYPTPMNADISAATWDDIMHCNLRAPFFLAQAAAPHLRQQGGAIVNITDIHAASPMRDYAVYCIAKSGLVMMTKALAKELGPEIRVNAVAPGAIAWPEGENALDDAAKQKIIQRTALLRHGVLEDIAKTVLFLARDADYMTGQVLNVDGGRSLFI